MQELTIAELDRLCAERKQPFALFVYTPMCGTCKLAERMLTVTTEALPNAPVYRININTAPSLAKRWQVKSVPALLLLDKGKVYECHYAIHSVGFLFDVLRTLT